MSITPHRVLAAALLLASSAVTSCARDIDAPPRQGDLCQLDADCNRGDAGVAACGFVRLCIAGRCESESGPRSRVLSCDAGT